MSVVTERTTTKIEKVGDRTLTFSILNGIKHGAFLLERSGKKEFEGFFENGILTGKFVSYHPEGQVMSIVNYKSGLLDGAFVFFYKSGIKQLTGNYKNGQYDGNIMTYDEFGDVIAIEHYVEGKLHGKSTKYYPKNITHGNKSQPMEIALYENGLLHGNKVSFLPSGKVMSIVPYYKGRPLRYGTMNA